MKRFTPTLLLFLALSAAPLSAQTSAIQSLQKERKTALEAIEATNKLISSTQKSAKGLLQKLQSITAQLNQRKKMIALLNKEINTNTALQKSITQEIEELEKELEVKKKQYAKALQSLSTHRSNYDKLMFLFSAESLSQTYRRMRYLHEYSVWRKMQSDEIMEKQEVLRQKEAALAKTIEEKKTLLASRTEENKKLQAQEREQRGLVQSMKSKESALRKELTSQRTKANNLDKRIEQLIAEEARKAAEKAKKSGKKTVLTEEDLKLASTFEKNKGKLPNPIKGNSLLISKFGLHRHQELKYVEINNSGIDLQTSAGSDAHAVFKGVVTRIFVMPGYNSSVIVRHGNYLTIYANLSKVYVKVGESVATREALGEIYSDEKDNQRTVLHFQLWKETTKLNPELWLDL